MNQYFEKNNFFEEDFKASAKDSAEFVECSFTGIDFSPRFFSRFKFLDCTFVECNFSNANMKNASFRSPVFKKSKLMGLNWSEAANLTGASFFDSILDYSVFHSMNLKGFVFSESRMHEVDFYEAKLMKSSFDGCSLKGASFNKANLSEADFRNAYDYYIDVRDTVVTGAKFNLPEALTLLSALKITIE